MLEKSIDPFTGKPFIPKRNNQKFASRKNQVAYNNLISKQKRDVKSHVENVLKSNLKLLQKVLGKNEEKIISKDYLLGGGFCFNYHTQILMRNKIQWYCTYNIGVHQLKNNRIKIRRFKNTVLI